MEPCPFCKRSAIPTVVDWRVRFARCRHLARVRITADDPATIQIVASWLAAQIEHRRADPDFQKLAAMIAAAAEGRLHDGPDDDCDGGGDDAILNTPRAARKKEEKEGQTS